MNKAISLISIVLFLLAGANMSAQELVTPEDDLKVDGIPDSLKQQLMSLSKEKSEQLIEEKANTKQPEKLSKADSLKTESITAEFEKYGYYTDIGKLFSKLPLFGNDIFQKGSDRKSVV